MGCLALSALLKRTSGHSGTGAPKMPGTILKPFIPKGRFQHVLCSIPDSVELRFRSAAPRQAKLSP